MVSMSRPYTLTVQESRQRENQLRCKGLIYVWKNKTPRKYERLMVKSSFHSSDSPVY